MKLLDLINESSTNRVTSISSEGLEDIKKYEDFVPHVYPDKNKFAIGYGIQVDPKEYEGIKITEQQALEMMKNHLKKWVYPSIYKVDQLRDVPFNQNQFDALCSLIYNVGSSAFDKSKLRNHIINRNKEGVKKEWVDWDNKSRREKELSKYLGVSLDVITPTKKNEKITPKLQSTTIKK